uniref:GP41 n=1 Tax=Phthorimaea operculella granulovirus TaxID=192584 RepID=A0A1B2CS70_9BBAC|nr:GP41 [Phthorimaea operculella granulovirus]
MSTGDNLSWATVANMINMYRTNNTARLTPEQIACMNLVRDLFIKADPVPVNATKRFESDEQLVEYYANMEKKYGSIKFNGAHGIFDKSFVISPIMKAYADKFYKRRLNLAATHLSDVVKYQIAHSITQNKPLPLLSTDLSTEYLQTVHSKANIPSNVKQAMESRNNQQLNMCTDIISNVVIDVLTGVHKDYYINTCLTPATRKMVHRFRNNIAFLMNTNSTNVFNMIEGVALEKGQTEIDYSEMEKAIAYNNTNSNAALTQLAFENEALRRAKIQEMNIRYNNLL